MVKRLVFAALVAAVSVFAYVHPVTSSSDQMNQSLRDLGKVGDAIRQAKEAKRQEKLDSIQRVNDSLDAEILKIELEMRRRKLAAQIQRQKQDSIAAAPAIPAAPPSASPRSGAAAASPDRSPTSR